MSAKEKRTVALSVASLAKVWDWCERNESSPIAAFYVTLCESIGVFDEHDYKVSGALWDLFPKMSAKQTTDLIYMAKHRAMESRDKFGRVILNGLKSGKLK